MPLFGPPNVKKLEAKRDVEGLTRALHYEKDSLVRAAAAKALGAVGDRRALEPLLGAFRDAPFVDAAAAAALGRLGDPRVVEPLISVLQSGQHGAFRAGAAEALGRLGDPRALEPLIAGVNDQDALVAQGSVEALGAFRDPRAVDSLVQALMTCDGGTDGVPPVPSPQSALPQPGPLPPRSPLSRGTTEFCG